MQNYCWIVRNSSSFQARFGIVGGHRGIQRIPRNLRHKQCSHFTSHLFMCDRNESVFGKLPQDVEVRPHVQLTTD